MAIATTKNGCAVEITGIDSTGADWDVTDLKMSPGSEVSIMRITFYPTAASDRLIMRNGGIDNAAFFDSGLVSAATDPRSVFFSTPIRVSPVIDVSDCVVGTPANSKVIIILAV